MSRPQLPILLTHDTDDEYIAVIHSTGLWAVMYKDKPVNVRKKFWVISGITYKYLKTVYPNAAPANNLCAKLNDKFNCSDFTVIKII